MVVPMPMPSSVVIEPYSDEAVPAIWPCGSIASAVKLAIISPNANIISAESTRNSGSGSICSFTATSRIPATATKPTNAPCDITRMPSLPTNRALKKPPIAVPIAMPANASGK
jgi:hypothetical protein